MHYLFIVTRNHYEKRLGREEPSLRAAKKGCKTASDGGPGEVHLECGMAAGREISTIDRIGEDANQGRVQLIGVSWRHKDDARVGDRCGSFRAEESNQRQTASDAGDRTTSPGG